MPYKVGASRIAKPNFVEPHKDAGVAVVDGISVQLREAREVLDAIEPDPIGEYPSPVELHVAANAHSLAPQPDWALDDPHSAEV